MVNPLSSPSRRPELLSSRPGEIWEWTPGHGSTSDSAHLTSGAPYHQDD